MGLTLGIYGTAYNPPIPSFHPCQDDLIDNVVLIGVCGILLNLQFLDLIL